MSKGNPLGLIASYGDSDEESDDGALKRAESSKMKQPAAAYDPPGAPAGIHPSPIPHCPWSACYDENSGFTYYWNHQTNAVTWEAPPEYLLALKLAQQHLHTSGSTEVSAEEWQLYQQALAEKQNTQNKVIAKAATIKSNSKKQDKTSCKDKLVKNSKKRPVSDDEDEKIELITSYHNSDSDSNDETEKTPTKTPPLPKPPSKQPSHPPKKQKTKPVVEYGPPLPPNQNYTVPIGPELPPELLVSEKPKSPEVKAENPDVKVEENQEQSPTINTKNIFEIQEQYITTSALSQPLLTTRVENNVQDIDDQNCILVNHHLQIEQVQEDIKAIKEDVKTILHNQHSLWELQNKILLKLSEFQTQFEAYTKLTSKSQQNQDPAITLIKNLNELEDFEKNISDLTTKEKLYKKFSVVCSKGPGKGMTNAYYLIDAMFERSFFINCTWTGASKGETPKICFKAFNKTIEFFFDVIHGTDETFKRADCDKFFKIILKNAHHRCESNQRTSTSKQRPKNKNNSDVNNSTSITTSTTTCSVTREAKATTI